MTTTQPFDFRGFLDHLKQTGELAEISESVALDYEVGAFSHPRITTVNVDCHGIGRLAVRRLIELLQAGGRNRHDEIILTSFRVVEREST